jgi:hypothetical protein
MPVMLHEVLQNLASHDPKVVIAGIYQSRELKDLGVCPQLITLLNCQDDYLLRIILSLLCSQTMCEFNALIDAILAQRDDWDEDMQVDAI